MELSFWGSSLVSSYWNGAATYYRGLLRALAGRGHRITFYEPDAYGRQQNRDLAEDPTYARVVVYRTEQERDALLDRSFAASDWVFKCSGVGAGDAELGRAVADRSRGAARSWFWDVDAPATLARLAADRSDPFAACIPRYDHVFTYGGGDPVVAAYLGHGARGCTPIYNGLDPDEHRPIGGAAEPRWDLLFMGNRLPDREARVDEFFFRAAELCPDARFALGGEGWGDHARPANVEYLGHVPTAQHNAVNAAARLVLNVHRDSMVANGWSPATRMFEAAGAAACQVSDSMRGIDEFFEPGREILLADDAAAVADAVRSVTTEQARRIGEAARARALRDHTYDARAATVDRLLREPAGVAR